MKPLVQPIKRYRLRDYREHDLWLIGQRIAPNKPAPSDELYVFRPLPDDVSPTMGYEPSPASKAESVALITASVVAIPMLGIVAVAQERTHER